MIGVDYYKQLNLAASEVFDLSTKGNTFIGTVQDLKTNLHYWEIAISPYTASSIMLRHALEELDISCFQILQGLYRGAFTSLRLALEMLCGAVYFSAHNIEYIEWKNGSQDIIWSKLICPDNGVLSKRFSNAYFPELSENASTYHQKIKKLYRSLSEMVHGNNSTRQYNNPCLEINLIYQEQFSQNIEGFKDLANFILSLRFLKEIDIQNTPDLETYLIDSLENIESIRVTLGGPKSE